MPKIVKQLCCVFLALFVALSVLGCSPKKSGKKSKKKSTVQTESVGSVESNSSEDAPDRFDGEEPDDFENDNTDISEEDDEIHKAVSLTVLNNSTPLQNNFLGFNAVYHGFAYLPVNSAHKTSHTEKTAQAEFNMAKESGINIARTYFSYDWAWNTETKSFDYDSERMIAFYKWCGEMKKRNIEVLLNHWYTHRQLFEKQYSYGKYYDRTPVAAFAGEGEYNEQKTVNNFAEFAVTVMEKLYAKGYSNVRYLSLATEPGSGASLEQAGPAAEQFLTYANATHLLLKQRGLRNRITIMGPNEGTAEEVENVPGWLMRAVAARDKLGAVDLYSSHAYVATTIEMDTFEFWDDNIKQKLEGFAPGKDRFIFDEYGNSGDNMMEYREANAIYGTQIAMNQMAVLTNGVRSSFMWTLADQQWPDVIGSAKRDNWVNGVHMWGLMPNVIVSNVPHPGFYCFSLMSRYMGVQGSKIYGADYGEYNGESVYAALSQMPDGNISIAVLNANMFSAKVQLNLQKSLGRTLYRFEFDPNEIQPTQVYQNIQPSARIVNCKNGFTDVVPGLGVTVYTTKKP